MYKNGNFIRSLSSGYNTPQNLDNNKGASCIYMQYAGEKQLYGTAGGVCVKVWSS